MGNERKRNYKLTPTFHTVNVFHKDLFYRFFRFSCFNCVLKSECEPTKHKRDICKVAHEARELLAEFTTGHVSSFLSDDFYIKSNRKNTKTIQIFNHLLGTYTINDNDR